MADEQQQTCEYTCDSGCQCGCSDSDSSGSKKTATLLFRRDALLYDIGTLGYVEADIMQEAQQDAKHQTFDIGQDGNRDRVTRVMNLAMSEMVDALYPYTKHELPDDISPLDDLLRDPLVYEMRLTVPKKFSATTLRLIREFVHEYIVCRVMADWLSITKPEAAANWIAKADNIMTKTKNALNARTGMTRRPMKPF